MAYQNMGYGINKNIRCYGTRIGILLAGISRLDPLPNRIGSYIRYNVWAEITYPFPNFNGCTVEVWERMSNFIPHFTAHVIIFSSSDLS